MAQKSRSSGGNAKYGRNKDKCAAYRAEKRRFKNKLRRVKKCNGPEVAMKYEREYHDRVRHA